MGFELMEIKNDGSHYEFIIRETVMNNIVDWQDLPDVGAIKKYLKEQGKEIPTSLVNLVIELLVRKKIVVSE